MIGVASYYGRKYQGKKTASGEIYDMNKMTAAHRTLPFGVNVRVTDDLSLAAARKLGIIRAGRATVKLEIAAGAAGSAELDLSSGEAPQQK